MTATCFLLHLNYLLRMLYLEEFNHFNKLFAKFIWLNFIENVKLSTAKAPPNVFETASWFWMDKFI